MGTVQLQKAGFYHLCRIIVTGYADRFSRRTYGIHDKLRDLFELIAVYRVVLSENVVLNVPVHDFTVYLPCLHPIRSIPPFGGWGI